jgi:hypothetical protein
VTGEENVMKKLVLEMDVDEIVEAVWEDFGQEIDLETAAKIKEADNNGHCLWASEHLITTDHSALFIEPEQLDLARPCDG